MRRHPAKTERRTLPVPPATVLGRFLRDIKPIAPTSITETIGELANFTGTVQCLGVGTWGEERHIMIYQAGDRFFAAWPVAKEAGRRVAARELEEWTQADVNQALLRRPA